MKIAFDVDGVVLNSIELILDRINEKKGPRCSPTNFSRGTLRHRGWTLRPSEMPFTTWPRSPTSGLTRGAVEVLSRVHRVTGAPLLFITGRSDPDSRRSSSAFCRGKAPRRKWWSSAGIGIRGPTYRMWVWIS